MRRHSALVGLGFGKEGNMSAQDNAKIARIPYDCFNNRRLEEMEAITASDAELLNVATGERHRGPEGLRQFMQNWINAFPDGRIDVRRVLADETGCVVEFVGRGTHAGSLKTPAGDVPATNRVAELPCCDVLEIQNGKVTSVHSYFDLNTLMRQLGLVAEGVRTPQAAPSPTYTA
jgi:steroid delta-isomerase-like uncharacterized protein